MTTSSSYPLGSDYRDALFDTMNCFKDPSLVGGIVETDAFGMPKPISGNFASVFTIRATDGKRWAVKCFTRNVEDQAVRYQRISETLAGVDKPWRVPFEYVADGILCQGKWFPILKMEWIEATGLISFIESHLWQPPVLADLASKFAQMVNDLGELEIAHGDLQHGNLLVTPSRELKLIDYDGMYVSGLTHLGASENGHANYQSPSRTMRSWGSNLDHFSAWLIYGSLVALTIDPMLWTLFHHDGDEALLFHKEDFLDPNSSRALALLSQCVDVRLKTLGEILSPLMTEELAKIPALEVASMPRPSREQLLFDPTFSDPLSVTALGGDGLQGISDLLRSLEEGSSSVSANDPTWVLSQMPPKPLVPFSPVNLAFRVFSLLLLIALVVMAVLWGVALVSAIVAGLAEGSLVALMGGNAIWLYRRTEEFSAKRTERARLRQYRAADAVAKRAVAQAEKSRRAIERRLRDAIEPIMQRADDAKALETKELSSVESTLASQLSKLRMNTQSLQTAEANEIESTLRSLQRQHQEGVLKRAYLRSASIQGVGQRLLAELASYGVTTAYDFVSFEQGRTNVRIVLRTGDRFHVDGIGEAKARALLTWRNQVEYRAKSTQPSSLSVTHLEPIKRKYETQLHLLVQSEQEFRSDFLTQRRQVQDRWKINNGMLELELLQTRQSYLQELARGDLELGGAKKVAREASWRLVSGEREYSAYQNVTFSRFLWSVIKS